MDPAVTPGGRKRASGDNYPHNLPPDQRDHEHARLLDSAAHGWTDELLLLPSFR